MNVEKLIIDAFSFVRKNTSIQLHEEKILTMDNVGVIATLWEIYEECHIDATIEKKLRNAYLEFEKLDGVEHF